MPNPISREGGYIVVLSALLLPVLMIFAALAVDVGAWTAQAARLQRASDTAALAGASFLPDQTRAESAARSVADRNLPGGLASGAFDLTVTFPSPDRIAVDIAARAETYFASVLIPNSFEVSRASTAVARPPIPMGSPTNVLGFGPYGIGDLPAANYWLLENNDCSPAHFGDLKAAQRMGAPWCDVRGAGSQPSSPEWKRRDSESRQGGYTYVVEIPPGLTETSRLWLFDPGKCRGYEGKPSDGRHNRGGEGTVLEFRQWSVNGTPSDLGDDFPVTPWRSYQECAADLLPANPADWTDRTQGWTSTSFTFPGNSGPDPQFHIIQTRVGPSIHEGWNYFAMAVRTPTLTSCSTITNPRCPTISAEQWISVSAQGLAVGEAMELYLAEIGPEYFGERIAVNLPSIPTGPPVRCASCRPARPRRDATPTPRPTSRRRTPRPASGSAVRADPSPTARATVYPCRTGPGSGSGRGA
jgi:hypothetical protein